MGYRRTCAMCKRQGGTDTAENHRAIGTQNELKAAAYLAACGYEILGKNYRCRFGEIDLIARKEGYLVFVEVKYRSSLRYGNPAEAVSKKKQRIISRVAMHYCFEHHISDHTPIRFDVVAILQDEISLYVNAFPCVFR